VDLNCDGQVVIAAFGDSITRGVGDTEGLGYPGRVQILLPDVDVYNLGNPGENTYSGKSRAGSVFSQIPEPDYSVVLEGVNDYWVSTRSVKQTHINLSSIMTRARDTGSLALLGKLTQVKRASQKPWVKSLNAELGRHTSIDFYSLGASIISWDLLHPSGEGYQKMATLVVDALNKVSASNRPVDSDGDVLYDFAEQRYGSNPYVYDTDGDGIGDGAEVFTYGSSPISTDSDGDGVSDTVEILQLGSDPASPAPGAPTITGAQILG